MSIGISAPRRMNAVGSVFACAPTTCSGSSAGEHPGNASTDIATLSAVALITEAAHQLGEGSGDAWHVPARFAHRNGEPEAGDRRRHDVEGVGRVAAVGARVGQWPDDLDELRDRTGIAVADDQRQRIGLGRADVEEVDGLTVDLGRELRKRVEPSPPASSSRTRCANTRQALSGTRAARRGSSRRRELDQASGCGPNALADPPDQPSKYSPGKAARSFRTSASFSSGFCCALIVSSKEVRIFPG